LRLITSNLQDPEPSGTWLQAIIRTLKNLSFKKATTLVVALIILGSFALPAHAGIVSFLGSLFGVDNDLTYDINSQNVALLRAALNPDPNPAKGGGDVTIADGQALVADNGPLGSRGNTEIAPRPEQISVYVVRSGDSLSQIAKLFGVTTDTIIWANDIGRGGVIHEGQTLVILPVSGIEHTVKSGDTLASIAKKYGVKTEEIISFNGIQDGHVLAVGDSIIVPDGKIQSSYTSTATGAIVRGAGGPAISGYFSAPVTGYKRTQGLHGYNAVDLATPTGTPILAAASGDVIISRTGWNGGYGNYIVIAHPNGTQTVYSHNSSNIVYAGQSVVQGQVIGYVGNTGRSTGPHVHFEVRGAKNPF